MAERMTFEGDFCEIARCRETRWGKHCPDGACSQRKVWERLKQYEDSDAFSVVRCNDCVYWMPKHVKMNDGTIRFYEPNEGIVTIEKGINVGSYCKRFDDVTVHGYRDGETYIYKTKAWCNKDDFCSYGERKTNGNEDRA